MAIMAVYYRFSWQMEGGEIPLAEMFGTFALLELLLVWSSGRDGLTKCCGTILSGICTSLTIKLDKLHLS
ncbi:unnamed protein product [Rhodiola kirilowii]